jgi:hypothetical protein
VLLGCQLASSVDQQHEYVSTWALSIEGWLEIVRAVWAVVLEGVPLDELRVVSPDGLLRRLDLHLVQIHIILRNKLLYHVLLPDVLLVQDALLAAQQLEGLVE